MQHGSISRIRLVDVPPPNRGNKTKDIIRRAISNIEAGIGPQEALDIEVPEPNSSEHNPAAGHYLMGLLNKTIKERKLPVDVMRLAKDGKWHIYIVGR